MPCHPADTVACSVTEYSLVALPFTSKHCMNDSSRGWQLRSYNGLNLSQDETDPVGGHMRCRREGAAGDHPADGRVLRHAQPGARHVPRRRARGARRHRQDRDHQGARLSKTRTTVVRAAAQALQGIFILGLMWFCLAGALEPCWRSPPSLLVGGIGTDDSGSWDALTCCKVFLSIRTILLCTPHPHAWHDPG